MPSAVGHLEGDATQRNDRQHVDPLTQFHPPFSDRNEPAEIASGAVVLPLLGSRRCISPHGSSTTLRSNLIEHSLETLDYRRHNPVCPAGWPARASSIEEAGPGDERVPSLGLKIATCAWVCPELRQGVVNPGLDRSDRDGQRIGDGFERHLVGESHQHGLAVFI